MIIKKAVNYLVWFKTLSPRARRQEVARRISPKARLQHHLDSLVGPFGYWKELQAYQFNVLKTQGLKPEHRLLDVGCGPLQGGLAFIEYLNPGNYAGIDLRPATIAEARKQVARAGLEAKRPRLAQSACFGGDVPELGEASFDYVWACQILCHLTGEQVGSLFEQAARRLAPGGKFYGDIIGAAHEVREDSQWSGFSFHLHTLNELGAMAAQHGLTLRPLGTIDQFGYPKEINLHTNDLFELSRAGGQTKTA